MVNLRIAVLADPAPLDVPTRTVEFAIGCRAQDAYADAVNAAPAANLSNYAEIIRSLLPGTNSATTTSSGGASTAKSVLGGAASGAAMGSMLAGASSGAITGPMGMGLGAAVGGLAGLL